MERVQKTADQRLKIEIGRPVRPNEPLLNPKQVSAELSTPNREFALIKSKGVAICQLIDEHYHLKLFIETDRGWVCRTYRLWLEAQRPPKRRGNRPRARHHASKQPRYRWNRC